MVLNKSELATPEEIEMARAEFRAASEVMLDGEGPAQNVDNVRKEIGKIFGYG